MLKKSFWNFPEGQTVADAPDSPLAVELLLRPFLVLHGEDTKGMNLPAGDNRLVPVIPVYFVTADLLRNNDAAEPASCDDSKPPFLFQRINEDGMDRWHVRFSTADGVEESTTVGTNLKGMLYIWHLLQTNRPIDCQTLEASIGKIPNAPAVDNQDVKFERDRQHSKID